MLRSRDVGRLAVSVAGRPDIFPINYIVDHGTLVVRTAEGSKLAASVVNPVVAFEVDWYSPADGEAWSVVIKGLVGEVKRLEDLVEAMDLPLFPWHAAPKQRYLRIEPEEITGRRFSVLKPDPAPAPPR